MSTVRNHPLEGDGCRVGFFQHLLRANGVASAVDVQIPDTIVFEHNCPRAWFFYDPEINEVRRRVGKDLQAGSIIQEFSAVHSTSGTRAIEVVATYTYLTEGPADDEPVVTVQYLTAQALAKFIVASSPTKREGILQKYVVPIESNECVIQAVWSPRICVVRRRTNRRALLDVPRIVEEKFVTFDGPEHYSKEVACSKDTVHDVTMACEDIAAHLSRTLHLKASGMILMFKLNPNATLRLLWCSSIRFHGPRVSNINNPLFACPALENDGDDETAKQLVALSQQDAQLQRDLHPLQRHNNSLDSDGAGHGSGIAAGRDGMHLLSDEEATLKVQDLAESWFEVNEETSEEHRAICDDEIVCLGIVEDTLYAALCHFQQHTASEYKFRFPLELSRYLGGDDRVDALVNHLGLERLPSDDLVVKGISGRSVNPTGDDLQTAPIPALMNVASGWVRGHFNSKKKALLSRALPLLEANTMKLLLC